MSDYERPVVEPIGSVHELTQTIIIVKRGRGFDRRGRRRRVIFAGS